MPIDFSITKDIQAIRVMLDTVMIRILTCMIMLQDLPVLLGRLLGFSRINQKERVAPLQVGGLAKL